MAAPPSGALPEQPQPQPTGLQRVNADSGINADQQRRTGGGTGEGSGEKPSYASILSRNKRVEDGFQLDFHSQLLGADEVEFEEEEWAEGIEEWENSLVGFVFGFKVPHYKMKSYAENRFGGPAGVTVSELQKGIFLFKFSDKAGMERVLSQGPWSYDSKPLVLRPWTPDMSLEFSDITKMLVWVKLPGLNVHLWKPKPLSKITSTIGRPVCTDGYTASQERLQFARVCVEIDAGHDLVHHVTIRGPKGVVINQKIEYEWVPSRCSKCKVFGHATSKCTKKVIQRWEVITRNVDVSNEDVPVIVEEVNTDSDSTDEEEEETVDNTLPQQKADQASVTQTAKSSDVENFANSSVVPDSQSYSSGNSNIDADGFISPRTKKKTGRKQYKVAPVEPITTRSKSHVDQAVNLHHSTNG